MHFNYFNYFCKEAYTHLNRLEWKNWWNITLVYSKKYITYKEMSKNVGYQKWIQPLQILVCLFLCASLHQNMLSSNNITDLSFLFSTYLAYMWWQVIWYNSIWSTASINFWLNHICNNFPSNYWVCRILIILEGKVGGVFDSTTMSQFF